VLIELASGGEALLLAESMTVSDFIGLMRASPTAWCTVRAG